MHDVPLEAEMADGQLEEAKVAGRQLQEGMNILLLILPLLLLLILFFFILLL